MKNTLVVASIIFIVASLVSSQPIGWRPSQDGRGKGKARERAERDGFVQIPAGEFMMGPRRALMMKDLFTK
jgi:hypothetical protein